MLTKTKTIRRKLIKNKKKSFFQKFKKCPSILPRGSNNQTLKEINALDSEIIVSWTDGRTDDRRRKNCDFMSSADIIKQS